MRQEGKTIRVQQDVRLEEKKRHPSRALHQPNKLVHGSGLQQLAAANRSSETKKKKILTPLVTCVLSACTPPLALPALHVLPLLALLTGGARPLCCALPKPPTCSLTICSGGKASDEAGIP